MKKILLFFACFCFIAASFAEGNNSFSFAPIDFMGKKHKKTTTDTVQTKDSTDWQRYWKLTGVLGLNVTQTSFTNWAAGGQNNANGVVFANLNLAYKKGFHSWEAHLQTELGMMYTSGALDIKDVEGNVLEKTRWRKSSDKIDFSTKYGFEFQKRWFVTVLASFKTQYARGLDYNKFDKGEASTPTYVSDFMSPSYSDFSVGVDWKPTNFLSCYLSPVAGRITTCTIKKGKDDIIPFNPNVLKKSYGIDTTLGKDYKADLGLTFKAQVNYTYKSLTVISSLVLFTPYTSKEQPFGNFDVDWDFAISYRFLKVLNVSLMTSLKYYDLVKITDKNGNTGPRVQFKEILGLGIGYSF